MKHNTCVFPGPCPHYYPNEEDCEDCEDRLPGPTAKPRKPNKNGWTLEASALLVYMIDHGETFQQAADKLNKTPTACYHKYYRIKRKQREMRSSGVSA